MKIRKGDKPISHLRFAQNHMATTFEFCISCGEDRVALANRALAESHFRVSQLEREISEFLPESPVHRLNEAEPGFRVELPLSAIELLEHAERIRNATQGSFDCTAKSLPTQGFSGTRIEWDRRASKAWRNDRGTHVGFGAIGKGFALDQVRLILASFGFHDFLLSAGGSSIAISGFAGPNDPWHWGWSWKRDCDGSPLGVSFVHGSGIPIAIGVSGTQEKGNHIINPVNGDRSTQAQSSLAACPSATDADALSTALFVSGWNQSLVNMKNLPVTPALAEVDRLGIPRWNGIFQKLWGSIEKLPQLTQDLGRASTALIFAVFCIFRSPEVFSAPDEVVDLSTMGLNGFTPYVNERDPWWLALPAFAFIVVLAHLKRNQRNTSMKRKMKAGISRITALALLWTCVERAGATEFEPMAKALFTLLGTKTPVKKTLHVDNREATVFYSKDKAGKPSRVAFIEKGVYEPNCTHTWVIGVNPSNGKITKIHVIEMSCPHAFPTRASSFMEQYEGKGPADVDKLDSQINTIAKATGSSQLTTEAVKRTITAYSKIKGQL